MKIKFTFTIVVVAVMSLSIFACSAENGSQERFESAVSWANHYHDIGDLCTEANLIAIGEIKNVINETEDKVAEARWDPVVVYFTDFTFQVDKVLKGDEVKEIILHQTGVSGKQEIKDDPLFKPGEEYILFLQEYETGKYFVLGGPQGRFKIINDKIFSMNRILPDKVLLDSGLDTDNIDKENFIDSVSANLK